MKRSLIGALDDECVVLLLNQKPFTNIKMPLAMPDKTTAAQSQSRAPQARRIPSAPLGRESSSVAGDGAALTENVVRAAGGFTAGRLEGRAAGAIPKISQGAETVD